MGRYTMLFAGVFVFATGDARAQQMFGNGFEESCFTDSDNDRLSNCEEAIRSLDFYDPDTDDDGLGDGDEVLGSLDGLDLPAFGVNPRRKDVLIEHDWQDDDAAPALCDFHTHKPGAAILEELRLAFAAMPVPNPDGTMGIRLIQDIGQGGIFNGGNFVEVANATIVGAIGDDFQSYKAKNFAPSRLGYFRYALHTHGYSAVPGSSGVAEIVGDDLAVTLGCSWNQGYIRNTLMHELGHNLGLLHGGDSNCNRKPNYNSIMNYRYHFDGIDADCQPGGDGVMNYSIGVRAPLDENHLDETAGMCGGIAIDWNTQDGGLSVDTSRDINPYLNVMNPLALQNADCNGILTTLTDHDDFAALNLTGLPGLPGGGDQIPAQVTTCAPPPQP